MPTVWSLDRAALPGVSGSSGKRPVLRGHRRGHPLRQTPAPEPPSVSLPIHTVASPAAASITSSAIHSSRSRDRASAGSADQPVPELGYPQPASFRHTVIRGVDGSRGIRYASSTHSIAPAIPPP